MLDADALKEQTGADSSGSLRIQMRGRKPGKRPRLSSDSSLSGRIYESRITLAASVRRHLGEKQEASLEKDIALEADIV